MGVRYHFTFAYDSFVHRTPRRIMALHFGWTRDVHVVFDDYDKNYGELRIK